MKSCLPGIYAVRAVIGKRNLGGVCYIGTRPTCSGEGIA
jgi:FAD synthase